VIEIRLMNARDLPLGMRLKDQAGWNQTEADWRRLLDLQPAGCFVAELDGVPVGTTAVCTFGPVAWVAMVLVEESVRGRGIGTALMEHALAFLDRQSVRTVRLDATSLGRPVYEKLGFVEEYLLHRYAGVLPPAGEAAARPGDGTVSAARPEHLDGVFEVDRAVTVTDRRSLLQRLFSERPEAGRVVTREDQVLGYLSWRPGSKAVQIGPCVARGDAGPLLLADAWRRHAGQRVFIDIPADNPAAVAAATAQGLTAQRPLLRMCRGPRLGERCTEIWASSGPEKG
jgi:GNAT superfamily N-acetyltransferase